MINIKQLSLADVKYVNDSLAAATSAFNSSTAKIPDMKSGDREDNDASAASQGDESGSSSGSLIPEEIIINKSLALEAAVKAKLKGSFQPL